MFLGFGSVSCQPGRTLHRLDECTGQSPPILPEVSRGQVPRMKDCVTVCSASSMARSRSPLSKIVRSIAVVRQACGSQR